MVNINAHDLTCRIEIQNDPWDNFTGVHAQFLSKVDVQGIRLLEVVDFHELLLDLVALASDSAEATTQPGSMTAASVSHRRPSSGVEKAPSNCASNAVLRMCPIRGPG